MTILNEGPTTIQAACQRIKTLVANKKAVYGSSRVRFQEKQFTLEEEKRVSRLEKSVEILMMMRGSTPSPSRQYAPRSQDPGYWSGQYNVDNRGRTATRGGGAIRFKAGPGTDHLPMNNYGRPQSPNVSNYTNPPPVPRSSYYTNPPPVPGSAYYVNQPPVTGSYGGQPNIRPPFYPPCQHFRVTQAEFGLIPLKGEIMFPIMALIGDKLGHHHLGIAKGSLIRDKIIPQVWVLRGKAFPQILLILRGMVPKIRDLECLIATNQQRTGALVQSPPPQHPAHSSVPDKQHLNSNGLSK